MASGILLIDKPQDFTSFDVVAKLRGILKVKRIGHSGTLDPLATGVLPVFVGGATKFIDFLPNSDKEYIAAFRLGITTDTQDITGQILSQSNIEPISAQCLEKILANFRGDIMQTPPMYSAVKVDGQKLYNLARRGLEIERKSRSVTIKNLEILDFDGTTGTLLITGTKGFYVRTLIHDIGKTIGCGAVMTALRRTRAGQFKLTDCHNLLTFDSDITFFPIDYPFLSYCEIFLDNAQTHMFENGVKLDIKRIDSISSLNLNQADIVYRVYSQNKQFLGLAKIKDESLVIVKRYIT